MHGAPLCGRQLSTFRRGTSLDLFYPYTEVSAFEEKEEPDEYSFLYDYETTVGHKSTEEIYQRETAAALAMLRTDEAKARANYILRRLGAVVRNYPTTSTALHIKTSCDRWRTWL